MTEHMATFLWIVEKKTHATFPLRIINLLLLYQLQSGAAEKFQVPFQLECNNNVFSCHVQRLDRVFPIFILNILPHTYSLPFRKIENFGTNLKSFFFAKQTTRWYWISIIVWIGVE